ncbi:MAG: hypothetical protein AMS22_04755 [Thiotrichales bacterium SG8_50]|nr:MAG: hypothetical protein AMS22_04755 [Thiotrichales bacterium SG8_50]
MHWREPLWLLVGLQPLLIWLIYRWLRRRSATAYAERALLPWVRHATFAPAAWRRALQTLLVAAAWLCLAVALAGPRIPLQRFGTDAIESTEVIAVVDLSRSMAAQDILPSRIERAKLELHDLLRHMRDERLGLVVFAHRPHLLAPPTSDRAALAHYVDTLETRLLPTEGSDLAAALRYAASVFSSSPNGQRAVLLLSNGPDSMQDAATHNELAEQARALRRAGIAVYILGLGTAEGEALFDDHGRWLQHEGVPLRSYLQETALRQLAEQAGGRYITVRDTHEDWDTLYHRGIALLGAEQRDARGEAQVIYQELYATAMLAGLFALLAAVILIPAVARVPWRATSVAILLVTLGHVPQGRTQDMSAQHEAYAAYQAKHFAEAERLYSNIPGHTARMGQGASAYLGGNFDDALRQFTRAVLAGDNNDQRADAIFNLANAYYQIGDYENAAVLFADVLHYRPDDQYAAMNYEFVVALYREVRRAVRENRLGQGRGPRAEIAREDTQVGSSRLSLADDEPTPVESPLPPAGIDADRWQALIERGLEHARMATARVERQDDAHWTYEVTDARDIALDTMFTADQESGLWRRVFEMEEGFPAPLETPRDVPGTVPW